MTFDWEQYNKWDAWGKDIIIDWLTDRGHTMVANPDKYGIDLYSDLNGKLYLWEVEVSTRRVWTSYDDYSERTVSFLGRKKKWNTWPFYYCIICSETKAIVLCKSTIIYNTDYREERYVVSRDTVDEFYNVPKSMCIFIHAQG